MESLLDEHSKAFRKGNLSRSIVELQKTIDQLSKARAVISSAPANAPLTLARLQNPIKLSFEEINHGLKDVHHGINKFAKAMDKKFKDKPLPTNDYDALSMRSDLVSRAIGMHLLREGQFSVAATFFQEMSGLDGEVSVAPTAANQHESRKHNLGNHNMRSETLRRQFGEMYYILDEMKTRRNLNPATTWARTHSTDLEIRGSNLEFELASLQFRWLFEKEAKEGRPFGHMPRQTAAFAYAREHFAQFQGRHLKEIQCLMGAMAFCPNLPDSPYKCYFSNESAWDDLAVSFTREFCSLLGLSADSPVYITATAGAIALPTLQKLQLIMETKRTEWTTQNELPVEIPLPPTYRFHSIFVCPVSKEQSTDENPPMMMPCGHVIAQESLQRLGKVSKFKCPYCPGESRVSQAEKVFL